MKLRKRIKNLDLKSPNVCEYLSRKINNFCIFLDKEYDINAGGCCWVAYCLAELLEKTGIKYNIELVSCDNIDDIISLEELNEGLDHYFLSIMDKNNDIYYLNDDCCNSSSHNITSISKENILNHYLKHDWCCCYEHCKNKTIKALLKNFYIDLLYDLSK